MKKLLAGAIGVALLACCGPGLAQVPETLYHQDSTGHNVPLWRAFVDVVNSQDEQARVTQSDLNLLAEEYDGECFSAQYDRHGTETIVDGVDVRSSLESAAKRADYIARGEVVSTSPGVYRGGTFGSVIELRINQHLSRTPFPENVAAGSKEPAAAQTIYYFYPAWQFEHKGVMLCGSDSAVPAKVPEAGDSMIVFARKDDVGDAPWFFGSANVFPVLGESGKTGRLWSTAWRATRSAQDVPGDPPRSLGAAADRLRRASEGGAR